MIISIVFNSITIMYRAGRDISTKASGYIRYLLFCTLIIVFLSVNVRAQETSNSWHVKNAKLRFRIEKDYTKSLVPNVSLLDIMPDRKSAGLKKWIEKNRGVDRHRINGKLCQNFLPSFGSTPIVYNLHKDFIHFVAKAGIVDRADPNAAISFEVYADKRLLFRSGPLTKQRPQVEINVGIPVQSKQLKLVTKAPDNQYFRWARWIDPGFMLRGKYPEVSSVRIYTAGYNPEDFVPEVFATSSGSRVNSEILTVRQGEPMDILFDSSEGNPSYLVYLVPKDKHVKSSSIWHAQGGLVLETKWTKKNFRSSGELAKFSEIFNSIAEPVGRSLVDNIHHGFPIHRMPEYSTNNPSTQEGFGLYYYKGFFKVDKKGRYSFATISRWDSYIAVDDKTVVSWPGKHDIQKARRAKSREAFLSSPAYISWNISAIAHGGGCLP